MSRVEVLTGPERRRRWSKEQKRAIVDKAFASGASLAEVARQSDVGRGQIYRWRRELGTCDAGFAEMIIAPEPSPTPTTPVATMQVDIGRDIRVLIPSTTPIGLASAVIKALTAR